MRERNYRTEALQNIPNGYYVLGNDALLRADDLVWSWTGQEFLRVDSPRWARSPFKDRMEDIICAVRAGALSEFASDVPTRRTFKLTTMKAEMNAEVKNVLSDNEILRIFMSLTCFCGKDKKPQMSHCTSCYYLLPSDARKALWRKIGKGYEEAFRESLAILERQKTAQAEKAIQNSLF
jgi:hypothetical protein